MYLKKVVLDALRILSFPLLLLLVSASQKKRDTLIWTPIPIISNKYWAQALSKVGWKSETLMREFYGINSREDYTYLFDDLVPRWLKPNSLRVVWRPYAAFLYIIRNAQVIHIPFSGGPLGETLFWRLEAFLCHAYNIKVIVIPYGADAYLYSTIADFSLRNGLLLSYPASAQREPEIEQRVRYWNRHADVIIAGIMMDGLARWDIVTACPFVIDATQWHPKQVYSENDGSNGAVKIMHTPNHRGFKGTEFLMQVVSELQNEGLQIELVLLEKVPNARVRELMQEVDIFAEQFIATGYAFSALEGMASGLPVMSNLHAEATTRIFRRYAFLNECPIFSATPETLKANLRILVTRPALREQLGRAGRQYIEKYHSYGCAQFTFGAIYDKLLHGKDVDLMNLFHPLKGEYNHLRPVVEHPLIDNRLPAYDESVRRVDKAVD
jgi:glycosyltransferase involved in cell wall biosynthesis